MQRTSIEYRISVNFNEKLGYSYKLESYISVIENERLENFSARLGFGMIFRVAFTFRVASSEYFIGETRSRNWCGKSVRMIKIGETAGSRIEEEDFYLEFPDSFRGISIVNIREEYLRGREVPPLTFP